jgi:hypothetical protein
LGKRRNRKLRPRGNRPLPKKSHADYAQEIGTGDLAGRERYFEIFAICALFAFGVYHSVLYFGHTIVPNSDFPAFFKTGREILSFQTPSSFKRVPALGLLQVLLSYAVGGQHPGLTAGWLLNAILHPFNLVLLWLVGRKIVGKPALWLAIIAILNPQVIYLLTEPIAETTLLFFILLTFYFIFKRSNWAYLFASITTMVRYEGAALILATFVMDLIHRRSRPQRVRAFLYSVLASVPLAIWMLGTTLTWKSGTTHYLSLFGEEYSKLYAAPAAQRTGFVKHVDVLWRTGFYPLLMPYRGAGQDFAQTLWKLSKTLAIVSFSFGSIYGLLKRQWKILALLIFFVPYFAIHTKFPSPLLRYHMPIFWIALLIAWFGLQSLWKLIDRDGKVPRGLVLILQASLLVIASIWLVQLVPALPRISQMSPTSTSLPYVAMVLMAAYFAARVYVHRFRHTLRELSILAVSCLIVVSNQLILVRTLGDGKKEMEFKLLADWYVDNAKPPEKLGVYMAGVVKTFAPRYAEHIVNLPKADNPSEFVKACYENDITYIAWATREGLTTDHEGYRMLGLHENMAPLREPRSIGPYEFITKVGWERGWIHIFRLRPPPDGGKDPPITDQTLSAAPNLRQ